MCVALRETSWGCARGVADCEDVAVALYARVRLLVDAYASCGAPAGTLGYVIERHPGGMCEVEVSEPLTGTTVALFVAHEAELSEEAECSSTARPSGEGDM